MVKLLSTRDHKHTTALVAFVDKTFVLDEAEKEKTESETILKLVLFHEILRIDGTKILAAVRFMLGNCSQRGNSSAEFRRKTLANKLNSIFQ
ncbi:hypothetical protein PanWU01x14_289670 [Parasponia andersonii]|uniref:Uncharacterized protein n=1 Tax=Parasponia andersonii TaxID=3476 RepID=A0A2P5AY06_PARAD|nr:hypothetical protein PanWU01x14_289670 [Parasponia andersonii]